MDDYTRDIILSGAHVAAEGANNGLTKEEVVDALIEKAEEKKRRSPEDTERIQASIDKRRGDRAKRDLKTDEALAFLEQDTREFETKGGYEFEERYPDPFGIPVSPADPEPTESLTKLEDQQREKGQWVVIDRGRGKERVWREKPGLKPGSADPNQPAVRTRLFSEPKYVGGRFKDDVADPYAKHTVAPAGTGIGGANGLATQLADMVARGEISEDALVPGSTTKTVGSLIAELVMEADPKLRHEADVAIGRQTAQRDAERFSPAARAISDAKAERRAIENISNIDNGLSSIQDIQSLGIASKKFNRGSNMSLFSVVPNADGEITDRDGGIDQMVEYLSEYDGDTQDGRIPAGVVLPGTDTTYRTTQGASDLVGLTRMVQHLVEPGFAGPEGPTVGYVGKDGVFIGDVDMTAPGNMPTRTQTWLEANLPDQGRVGGTSFGYPQVNIGDTLNLLSQRLGAAAPQGGIRTIEDLENSFVQIIDSKLDAGEALFNYDAEAGKAVPIADPGIDEVLYTMNYTKNEKAQLANALMQLEAARVSPVNQGFKYLYDQGIYDPRGQFAANNYGNDVALSRIGGQKVGKGDKGRVSIRKGLGALDGRTEVFRDRDDSDVYGTTPDGQRVLLPEARQDLIDAEAALPDAQKPFQGAPAGSNPPRQSFIRGNARGMSRSALAARMGTERADQAQGVEGRYLEDERRRRTPEVTSPERQAIKDRDEAISSEGAKRREQDRSNKARGIKRSGVGEPKRPVHQGLQPNQFNLNLADVPTQKERLEGEIVANALAAEAKRRQVAAGGDLRSVGIANPQQATSAATVAPPEAAPLADRRGWTSGRPRSFQSTGFDAMGEGSPLPVRNRRTRTRGQTQSVSAPAAESISNETQRRSEARPSVNRNARMRNIIGYGALGAGAAAGIGAGVNAYNSNQQQREEQYR